MEIYMSDHEPSQMHYDDDEDDRSFVIVKSLFHEEDELGCSQDLCYWGEDLSPEIIELELTFLELIPEPEELHGEQLGVDLDKWAETVRAARLNNKQPDIQN
jgi:hypothetical protein